jgi:uncharacterized protein YndB with AHSA1/START domain
MPDAETAAQEITITRVFDAPRELVWKAWTEPERLATWWGSPGHRVPLDRLVMEVTPGGRFSATSVSEEDGSEMTIQGVYRELVEPERLILEEPAELSWHEGAVSVVTLTDLGDGRTEMTVETTVNTTDEMRTLAEAGMGDTFDRLAAYLAS